MNRLILTQEFKIGQNSKKKAVILLIGIKVGKNEKTYYTL